MRSGIGAVVTRILAVIATLLVVGIVFRLIVAILSPVLPKWYMEGLSDGWSTLYGIVSPAMAPIMALALLTLVIWVIVGSRGRGH